MQFVIFLPFALILVVPCSKPPSEKIICVSLETSKYLIFYERQTEEYKHLHSETIVVWETIAKSGWIQSKIFLKKLSFSNSILVLKRNLKFTEHNMQLLSHIWSPK